MTEQSDYGGSRSTDRKEIEAEVKAAFDATIQNGRKPGTGKATPVAVEFQTTVKHTPCATVTTAADRHLKNTFAPVSVDLRDPIKITPQNRRHEQTRKEVAQKGITAVQKGLDYALTRSLTPDLPKVELPAVSNGVGRNSAPSASLLGNRNYVQLNELTADLRRREYGEVPEDYEELVTECEKTKAEYESIDRMMEEYARERNYRNYADTPWYKTLSAEHLRVWRRYQELENAKITMKPSTGERIGGTIAGTAKKSAGELISAAGSALEILARYGNSPMQIEMMHFNPTISVPERDITLIKEYVTDPTREFGEELIESGNTQIEEQKKGLRKFGRFAVDLGNAATQMVLDIGLGVATGGGIALPAAIRAFGGSAAEARADGAELNEQAVYATVSATLSYGIEQACNIAFTGIKTVMPGISDDVLTEGIEKLARKLASTSDGVELLMKFGKVVASGASEAGEEFAEAALQPFLRKLIYDPDAETILDDPELFWEYCYEALIGGVLGAVSGGVSSVGDADSNAVMKIEQDTRTAAFSDDAAESSPLEQGIDLLEQQYRNAVEQESSEIGMRSETDSAETDEYAEKQEQPFLPALQSDGECDIMISEPEIREIAEAQRSPTVWERLAVLGTALLNVGGMPSVRQLSAMGMDKPTARGIQSLVWLAMEGDPAARRAVESMIDLTADGFAEWSGSSGNVIDDGSHIENGRLKPNITYKTGEHNYFYETNVDGLIARAYTKELKLKIHNGRLRHNPDTYGKQDGDHAGHLFGDRFGGSPELDNLVSQAKMVNLREYKLIENQWARALKQGKKVSVDISIKYDRGNPRPVAFEVLYYIEGRRYHQIINN